MQKVCSPSCALDLAKSERAKEERRAAVKARRETRARLEAMKGISQLMAEADREFMAWIRARDRIAGHPCISSGRPLDWSGNNVDAGHYRSRGAASHLRYDPRNCHAQSKLDNRYLGGNVVAYRAGLVGRIGMAEVDALEADNRTHKWTRDELRGIRDMYRRKRKELEAKK